MKILIAVTCVAIIGFGTFWTSKTLNDERLRNEVLQASRDQVRCADELAALRSDTKRVINTPPTQCFDLGYVTEMDLRSAGRGDLADMVVDR